MYPTLNDHTKAKNALYKWAEPPVSLLPQKTHTVAISGKKPSQITKKWVLLDFFGDKWGETYLFTGNSDSTSFSIATLLLAWPVFVS